MPKKRTSYGRPLRYSPANSVIEEIERYQGKVPAELTPLALENLHSYINKLEDNVEMLRHRLDQVCPVTKHPTLGE